LLAANEKWRFGAIFSLVIPDLAGRLGGNPS
jgi:hypothetical protein